MGGGKGSRNKQKVPYYFMSMHYGICHGPIDSINQLWIKEKLAFCAELTEPSVLYLNRPELFGGETKEGGVSGAVEAYFGTADQEMTQTLASRFSRTTATMPAYRGVASLFFRGFDDSELSYVPAPARENGATRRTGVLGIDFGGVVKKLFGTREDRNRGTSAGFAARLLSAATDLFDTGLVPSKGGFWWSTNNPYLPSAWAHVTRIPMPIPGGEAWSRIQPPVESDEASFAEFIPPGDTVSPNYQYFDLTEYAEGIDLGLARIDMTFDVLATSTRDEPGFDSVLQNLEVSFINESGGTIDYEYDSQFSNGGQRLILSRPLPIGTRAINVAHSARMTFPTWGTRTMLESKVEVFYGTKGPLLCEGTGATGSPPDANPAYIIAEVLINRMWGMGHPLAGLDQASFLAAAETLYYEHFGLSMIWSQQTTIEKFVSEVLDHIQGTLFLDPKTGLWTLKLIRDDYDVGTLRTLNGKNCTASKRQRKSQGEIINEIVVSYKDFQTEKDKTVTFHDLAGIAQLGEPVSDTRNYYGIRSDYLANQVGARDIRTASYPLFSCDIEADRSFIDVRPGSVLKLDVEEDGIVGMVVRVGKVDYGQPGDSKIRFPVTEDIFSLPATTYRTRQTSLWVNPSQPPQPLARSRFVEAPVPLLLRSGVTEEDIADDNYPEVITMVLADDPDQDLVSVDLWGDYVSPSGEASQRTIGSVPQTPSMLLPDAWPRQPESTLSGARVRAMLRSEPAESGDFLMLDGGNEDSELVMLDVYDAGTDEWTVARGMFDTIPREWPAGHLIWHLGAGVHAFDPTANVDGVETEFKLLPKTNVGALLPEQAPLIEYTPSRRTYAPFRPANPQIDGNGWDESYYGPVLGIPSSVEVTWTNRNRLAEDGLAVRWLEGSVTPEVGQTTLIRVRERASQAIVAEYPGLTGESYMLDLTALTDYRFYDVQVLSERDGFESIQFVTLGLDIERLGYGSNYGYDYGENDG